MLPGTGPGSNLADEVLRAAALVGRDHEAEAESFLDDRLQVVEVAAARVGLVAEHHGRPLAVAHGVGA
jgi:hypothetical protein